MNVKNLMGLNEFQTAEKVCTVVQIYKATGISLQDLINDVSKLEFIRIQEEDKVFAKTLFEYLLWQYNECQEAYLDQVFQHIQMGYDPLTALSAASNLIQIGEAI